MTVAKYFISRISKVFHDTINLRRDMLHMTYYELWHYLILHYGETPALDNDLMYAIKRSIHYQAPLTLRQYSPSRTFK